MFFLFVSATLKPFLSSSRKSTIPSTFSWRLPGPPVGAPPPRAPLGGPPEGPQSVLSMRGGPSVSIAATTGGLPASLGAPSEEELQQQLQQQQQQLLMLQLLSVMQQQQQQQQPKETAVWGEQQQSSNPHLNSQQSSLYTRKRSSPPAATAAAAATAASAAATTAAAGEPYSLRLERKQRYVAADLASDGSVAAAATRAGEIVAFFIPGLRWGSTGGPQGGPSEGLGGPESGGGTSRANKGGIGAHKGPPRGLSGSAPY